MFTKKTIHDIDVRGKRVLLRADYNVPLNGDGSVASMYRLERSVPTLRALLEQDVRLVICSHLGRPGGKPDAKLSLRPVAARLGELLEREVQFAPDCVGSEAEKMAAALQPGQVLLLENLRFHPEEEKNDDNFAAALAKLGELFVQDGFGVVHRAHASTEAITHHLPSVAGLLLEKEVDTISNVMHNPERPLMAVIGGAKIADKIDVLNVFIDTADAVAIGGAMANTFLVAEGTPVGKSKEDADELPLARDILARAREANKQRRFVFYLPQDGVVTTDVTQPQRTRIVAWDAPVIADIENYPKQPPAASSVVAPDEIIADLGPCSGAFIAGLMQQAKTVVWNGTMGVTETRALLGPTGPFAHGTDQIIKAMVGDYGNRPAFTLVGGGDTAGYVEQRQLFGAFNHVSTGGGACLDLMAGHALPGVDALENK